MMDIKYTLQIEVDGKLIEFECSSDPKVIEDALEGFDYKLSAFLGGRDE